VSLGVGKVVPRHRYRSSRVAKELEGLLSNAACHAAAAAAAAEIAKEDAIAAACDGLECAI
jgi:UDP:flavonoid glycosyltransferase YjiC (YdhE family)